MVNMDLIGGFVGVYSIHLGLFNIYPLLGWIYLPPIRCLNDCNDDFNQCFAIGLRSIRSNQWVVAED